MNAIKNWILGLEHSVEHILSDFYSAIDRLEKLAVQKLHLADVQNDIANQANATRDLAVNEAIKAQQMAQKLKDLVN